MKFGKHSAEVLIKQRITDLSTEKIRQVDEAIRFALGLD
jgi:hypothetical protein